MNTIWRLSQMGFNYESCPDDRVSCVFARGQKREGKVEIDFLALKPRDAYKKKDSPRDDSRKEHKKIERNETAA